MNWYVECFRKYADFTGRARRSEYWYFVLFNLVFGVTAAIAFGLVGAFFGADGVSDGAAVGYVLYSLVVLVPGIAVGIRRLHDTGRSGWWLLIGLIPYVGGIIEIIFMCIDSQPGDNKWGPNPKGIYALAYPPSSAATYAPQQPTYASPQQSYPTPAPAVRKFCAQCGTSSDGAPFCTTCGAQNAR